MNPVIIIITPEALVLIAIAAAITLALRAWARRAERPIPTNHGLERWETIRHEVD